MTNNVDFILSTSIYLYRRMNEKDKKEAVKHVRDQLALSEKGKEIGFELSKDHVKAGKLFLNYVNKQNETETKK